MSRTGNSSTYPLPELLAPAGNRAALEGALSAGADAVYLGGTRFGARAYAENFTKEEIVRAIRDAHLLGAAIYLTANTLLKDEELRETVSFVYDLWQEGLDGVIVQDIGLLKRLSRECTGLPLHASTQLSVTVPEGVRFLQELGCTRVVPARELSLEEMRRLGEETGIEIEAFIHGAMCYSYSGRCLLSSFLGGRSGNRGRCAGTCRLPFRILDPEGKAAGPDARRSACYPLSMRDLCTLEILPELIDAGIASFKIEGRMKKPEYAAGVTAIYRKYLDRFQVWDSQGRKTPWKIEKEDLEKLYALYLRSALSTGYYHKRNGRDLITIGEPGYAGTEDALLARIRQDYLSGLPARRICGEAVVRLGEPASLTVWDENGRCAAAQGDVPQTAQGRPLTEEELLRRLRKTGGSLFTFDSLRIELQKGVFLPVSSLNALRREALSLLREQIEEAYKPSGNREEAALPEESKGKPTQKTAESTCGRFWADVCTKQQLEAALSCGTDRIILESPDLLEGAGLPSADEADTKYYLALPPIFRESSRAALRRDLAFAQEHCEGILVRTFDELAFVQESGYSGRLIADASLYAWNEEAAHHLSGKGCLRVYPLELSLREEKDWRGSLLTVYGRAPLMVSAGCIRKTENLCPKDIAAKARGDRTPRSAFWTLEDRKKKRFPVLCRCSHCYNVIYNSLPTSLHKLFTDGENGRGKPAKGADYLLLFTTENGEETRRILRWFSGLEAELPFTEFTGGHSAKSSL